MEQKQSKFYQTKAFRRWMAVLLAVVLLANNLVENRISLFAGEEQSPVEVTAPVETTEQTKSEPAPAPADNAENASEAEGSGQEGAETEAPAAGEGTAEATAEAAPEATAEPTAEATAEATEEATVEPTAEATEEPVATAQPEGNPVALALAQYGKVYVRIGGSEIYPSNKMNEKKVLGELGGGLAIAIGYQAEDEANELPESIQIAYATEEGEVKTAFRHAGDAEPVLYEDAILELTGDLPEGETLPDSFESAEWPLPRMSFIPHEDEEPEATEEPAPTEAPVQELPVIVAFVGYENAAEPLEEIALESEETVLAEVELPHALSVVLSDDSIVELPVAWATAEVAGEAMAAFEANHAAAEAVEASIEAAGEASEENAEGEAPQMQMFAAAAETEDPEAILASAAEETVIAAEEVLDVVPAWDTGSFALAEGVETPFIRLLGAPLGADTGSLNIKCDEIPSTQATYNLQDDTKETFQVRYNTPTSGTKNTILVVSAFVYGAKFTSVPVGNNAVQSAYINTANPYIMYVRLQDNIREKEVIIDFKMETTALTNAQAIKWIDEGTLPATGFTARAIIGTMNSGSVAPTETEELTTASYGSMKPEQFNSATINKSSVYKIHVPTVGELTNSALSLGSSTSSSNYYTWFVSGDTPYYITNNYAPHYQSTPLIEYTGMKIYVPHEKLKLASLNSYTSGLYYAPTTINYNMYAWTISARQSDAKGSYYIIRPPVGTRVFNNGTDSSLTYAYYVGVRPNWQLIDVNDELPYAADKYTDLQSTGKTELLYKIPTGSPNPAEKAFELDAALVQTLARVDQDRFASNLAYERKKSFASTNSSYNMAVGSTATETWATALRNTYSTDTVSGVKRELVPSYSGGPITETYDFPYELRPTGMIFNGSQPSYSGVALKRSTALQSITYTLKDGTQHTVTAAQITSVNSALQNGTSQSSVTFSNSSATNYVTKAVVVWDKVLTEYNGYTYSVGELQPRPTDNYGFYYGSYGYLRHEVATRLIMSTTSTHQDGTAIVSGDNVQVKYNLAVTGNTGKNFNSDDYLWYFLYIAPPPVRSCPTLYTQNNTYAYDIAFHTDGKSNVGGGDLYMPIGSSSTVTQEAYVNPIIKVFGERSGSTLGSSYALTNMTDAQAIGFLANEFKVDYKLGGWIIEYTTKKGGSKSITIPTGLTADYNVDLGVDHDGGDYLTSLQFSYEGTWTGSYSNYYYFMKGFAIHAWAKSFVDGSTFTCSGGDFGNFFVDMYGTAEWDNCICADKRHDHNTGKAQTSATSGNHRPGARFYQFRQAGLSWGQASIPSGYQTIYQGGKTNADTYASFNYGVYSYYTDAKPHYSSFWDAKSNSYRVPYGIPEQVIVELKDPEFILDLDNTTVFGQKVGQNLSMEVFYIGARKFARFTLTAGFKRNTSYFFDDGTVQAFYYYGTYSALVSNVKFAFTAVPGCVIGDHYPLGEIYFDFSQLLVDYAAPPVAASKDGRTKWVLNGAIPDSLGVSNTTATGNKLYKQDLSGYKVKVIMAAVASASLVPGLNTVYDFANRNIKYNAANKQQLEALMLFAGSPEVDLYEFTSYIQIPKKDKSVTYRNALGEEATVTSDYSLSLRGEPTLQSDSSGKANNVVITYTTAANPSPTSSYTAPKPTTQAGWDAITGVKIVVKEMPKKSSAYVILPLTAADKTVIGAKTSYIGGAYTFKTSTAQSNPYEDGLLDLGTYTYEDFNAINNGLVFFDVLDENGLWYSSTSYERFAGLNEVTVQLLDTDGNTVIDTTKTDASGRFTLKSYKGVANQIVEIIMPTTSSGTYKLTKQNVYAYTGATFFTSYGSDSDFPRDTRKLVLPAIPSTGFANVSAGIVRLPEISAPDANVLLGQTINHPLKIYDYLGNNMQSTSPAYSYAITAPADGTIAQMSAQSGNMSGQPAETVGTTYSPAIKGLKIGETTATISVKNSLGDEVKATFKIKVATAQKDITVTKVWSDSNDSLKVRPDKVTFQLYRKVGTGTAVAAGSAQDATAATSWKTTFEDMDEYDGSGNAYIYSVQEVNVPKNYTATDSSSGGNLSITNTIKTIKVDGKKVWNIIGSGYTIPASVIVDLYRSDNASTAYANQTLNKSTFGSATEWAFSFTGLPEYDKTGAAYTYTVKERVVPSGIVETYSGTTITNTYPADKDVKIKIEWDNTGAPAAQRPTSTTVDLKHGNGTTYKTGIAIAATDSWAKTVAIPPLDYNGPYSITAAAITDYTVAYRTETDGTLVAKYTFKMPEISVTGTKTWSAPTGVTKPNITVNLKRNGTTVDSKTLTSTDTGFTFSKLAKYDSTGVAYTYTVEETAVPGFTTTYSGYNITNTYSADAKEVDAVFSKEVTGNGAPDETFTFTMTGSTGAPMPSGSSGLTKTITGKKGSLTFGKISYDKPGNHTYTIKETAGSTTAFAYDGNTFTLKVDVADQNGVLRTTVSYLKGSTSESGITFTNVYTIPTSTLTGTLTWDDNANNLGGRPTTARVQLYRIVSGGTEEKVSGAVATPTGSSTGTSWSYSFASMPAHDNSGKTYTYYVKQENVDPNYTATASGMNLTDKLNTITFTGKKVWDIKGTNFTRPANIEVELLRENVLYKTQTVTGGATGDWDITISPLLEYKADGTKYTYTLREKTKITAVTSTVSGTTITNTYGDDAKVNVRVDWVLTGAPAADRQTSVSVDLIRDGGATAYKTATVTSTNSWKHTFTVPQNEYQGSNFTARGASLSKFTKVETRETDGTLVVTYTYIRPKVKVEGTKTWANMPTSGVTKPAIKVNLLRNGTALTSATVASGDAGFSFTNLEQYDDSGAAYTYTVTEDAVPGFTTTYSGYNITNTYSATPSSVSVVGTKEVSGAGAPDETFTFVLTGAAGAPMPTSSTGQTKTLTAKRGSFNFGTINYSVPGTFSYTIKETAGSTEGFTLNSGYDASTYDLVVTVAFSDGALSATPVIKKGAAVVENITFTNKYTIPTISSLSGTLTWDDTNNTLGGRPANVQVQLYRIVSGGTEEAVAGELKTVTGGATAATWSYSFTNQPKHDNDGKTYTYSVKQVNVDKNYTATASGMNLTDKVKTISINGKKIWDIKGSSFNKPSTGVDIELLRNGVLYRTQNVPFVSGNEWAYTISNLLEFDANGNSYTYTVREKTKMTAVTSSVSGYNITNSYGTDAKINVKVVWDTKGAPVADRPSSVLVDLIRDGGATAYKTATVKSADEWLYTFDVTQADYQGSDFTARGQTLSKYTKTETKDTDGTLVVTYKFIMPTVKVEGTKTWKDVPTGLTKPSVEFVLTRNGEEFEKKTISGTAAGYSFTGLDMYDDDGLLYGYFVSETPVPGYDSAKAGNNFTNTYNPTKAEIGVLAEKVVSGVGAPDVSFTFTLTGAAGVPMPTSSVGQVKTVSHKSSANFGNITYSTPGDYTYTVKETAGAVEGFTYDSSTYTITVKVEDNNGVLTATPSYKVGGTDTDKIVFTNVYTIPNHASINGTLTWDDSANALGGRPANVQVQLYRTPAGGVEEAVAGELKTVTGGATAATWTYSFTDQPKHDNDGKVYTYSVKQINVDKNYTATASGMNLTDKVKTISISGKKIWDIKGSNFTKPSTGVDIELLRNDTLYRTQNLPFASGNEWSYTISNLLEFDANGNSYTYAVREKTQMTAVTSSVSGYNITNYYGDDAVLTIRVDWDHTGAPASVRPPTVTINLFKDGGSTAYKTVIVRASESWTTNIKIPQADFQGAKFSITQNSLLPNYRTDYSEDNKVLVAENTFVMPKVEVTGEKTWVGTPTGVAKPSVQINLLRGGKKIDSTVIPNTKTTYAFTGLDKFDSDGNPYSYTVSEEAVNGYDSKQSGNNFTNTYNPTKAGVTVLAEKVVNGAGKPNDDFTFKLTATDTTFPMPTGSTAGVKTILAKEGAVNFGSITYANPGTYTYTVQEVAGSKSAFSYDGTVFTMTVEVEDSDGVLSADATYSKGTDVSVDNMVFLNEYTIPTKKVSGTVTWDDNSDALKGRPSDVTVQLYRIVSGGTKETVTGASKQVSGTGNVWNFDFENMPEHDNDGKTYTYSVGQASEDMNYTATATGMNITDKLSTISLTGKKVWDVKSTNFSKPTKVEVEVYRNGGSEAYLTKEVSGTTAATEWSFTITPLLKYDPNGLEYTYTLVEKTKMTAVTSNVVGTTITNSYGADAQVKVEVKWFNDNAPAADKPSSTKINLIRDGGAAPYATRTITATNAWEWNFPVTQADFQGSEFTASQELPSGYDTKYTTEYSKSGNVLIVTNTYIMPKTVVEGTKKWNKPTNVTEPSIEIKLFRNGVDTGDSTVIATGETSYKFEDLDKYDATGKPYAYTVKEVAVPGYDSVIKNTYNFENTYNPQGATISVLAKKDFNGVGAPLTEKFSFTLTGATGVPMPTGSVGLVKTVQATKGGVDFGTISYRLPGTYSYTIAEVTGSKAGIAYDKSTYQLTVTVTDEGDGKLITSTAMTRTLEGTTTNVVSADFVNEYTIPTKEQEITIKWDDNSDALEGRPDDVTIQLYRKTPVGTLEAVPGAEQVVTGTGDTWTFKYEDLPIHDENGQLYTYSVQEPGLDKNYTGTVSGFTITNKLKTIKVDGKKVWDIKGSGYVKPANLKVQLYRNGVKYGAEKTITGTASASQWTFNFDNMLEYDKGGNKYTYTAEEVEVPEGCKVSYAGMTITNTYGADQALKVKVTWDYTGAPAGDKPPTTTINLIRDDVETKGTKILNASMVWEWTFNVPQLDYNGHSFKVEQAPLTMYDTEYSNEDGWFIVHNTYKMPKIEVKGAKTWVNKPDELDYPTVEIKLFRSDNASTPIQTTTIEDGATSYKFENLPKYNDSGVAYVYTVSETKVPGYDTKQTGNNFTNTYNPEGAKTAIVGSKTKIGTAAPDDTFTFVMTPKNAANPMPTGSISGKKTIQTKAGAINFGEISYSKPGTYEYTITETAGNTNGYDYDDTQITATVVVEDPGNGSLTQTTSYSGGGSSFEFINEYTIPTEDKTITIKWVDDSDALKLRPSSATVQLYRTISGNTPEKVPTGYYIVPSAAGNSWTYTFEDMPVHDDNGKPYTYSVKEEDVDSNYSDEASGLVITNTLRKAGVTITKTASPAPETADSVPVVKAGDVITYTLKVTNTGARSVYDVRVMDIVPAGLTVVNDGSAQITKANANGTTTLMWRIAEIAKGATETIVIDVEVDALPSGQNARSFSNMAYARMPESEDEPFEPTDPTDPTKPFVPTDKPVPHQQLSLVKTANLPGGTDQDDTALVEGQVITYTLRMDNPSKAAGITVKDVLPQGMSFVQGSITGGNGGYYDVGSRSVIWANQTFAAGGVTLSFKAMVDKFTAADGTSKTFENTAVVTYKHTGESTTVSDDSNPVIHTATRREIIATKNAQLVNNTNPSGVDENGSINAPVEAKLGQEIQYAITVASTGYMNTARGTVLVEDVLHKDVAYVGAVQVVPSGALGKVSLKQAPTAANGNKVVWEITGLSKDETITIKFRAKAPTSADDTTTPNVFENIKNFSNTAKVIDKALESLTVGTSTVKVYTETEYTVPSNPTYHAVYQAQLVAHKTSTPLSPLANGDIAVVQQNDIIEYTIRVENPGMDDAINVRVMDILPEGVQYVPASSNLPYTLLTNAGKTTLMWQIAKLDHADRDTKALTSGSVAEIRFQVKVLGPITKAALIENKAYYRLPESATEAFPKVAGQPDPITDYMVTKEKVAHQVYTITSTADPVAGLSPTAAKEVKPGDIITYTTTVDAAAVIHGVTITDTLPDGMVPVTGSIQIIKPDGQVVKLPDTCYNGTTGTIIWPATDVTIGKTKFVFEAVVEPLTGSTMNKDYANDVDAQISDGMGGTIATQLPTQYFKTSVGYNTVTKTARLIVGGAPIAVDNGTAAAPVMAERGQQIQYTLTVAREAGTDNKSGDVIITDALPEGMSVVAGSFQATASSGVVVGTPAAKLVRSANGAMKPGVELIVKEMKDGDTATLVFRATMPSSADDPTTPAIETERTVINTATATDNEMSNMTYRKAVAGHSAGAQMYPLADFIRESDKTYHKMLGAALVSIKTADRENGSRVYGGDIITYTIQITNSGAIPAKDVLVRDTVPMYTTYLAGSATSNAPGTVIGQIGNVVTWIIPTIGVNQTVTLTLKCQVAQMTEIGTRNITNIAMVRETTPGGKPEDEIKEEGDNPTPSTPAENFQMIGGTITVRKTDAAGEALEGATITLKQLTSASPLTVFDSVEAVTNADGEVEFGNVPVGEYVVYESEAPEGYALNTIRRSVNIAPGYVDHLVIIVDQFLLDNATPNVGAGSRCVGDSPI